MSVCLIPPFMSTAPVFSMGLLLGTLPLSEYTYPLEVVTVGLGLSPGPSSPTLPVDLSPLCSVNPLKLMY